MLIDEIREQPQVVRTLLDREHDHVKQIAQLIHDRDIHHVLIAARGTSDNAAQYAKYALGIVNGLPVALATPSIYTLYDAAPQLDDTLVVGISQSGMSPDIVSVLKNGRSQGMMTLAITNAESSRLADAAEHVILCHAGEERAVAATKTYTTELTVLAMLSAALANDPGRVEALYAVPEALEAAIGLAAPIAQRADRYCYMEQCAVISRGYNYATSFEIALKLKELTYIGANPYSSADFMHGPIAVVERGFPVVVIAPSGRVYGDLLDLVRELSARRAELIIISDEDEILDYAQTPLRLEPELPEWLSPIAAVVPGQLLAYHLAQSKGLDPERPRGLNKVTETT